MQTSLAALTTLYRDPVRRYHDLSHISQIFEMANLASEQLNEVQMLAIWYHDAIYNPAALDNEERSVALAQDHLRYSLKVAELKAVASIIMDTKTHHPTSEDSKLVLDLDMSILGSHKSAYVNYARKVREEFAYVPYDLYAEKRSEILHTFLERAEGGLLFHKMGNLLNSNAIANLKWEITFFHNRKQYRDRGVVAIPTIEEYAKTYF